MQTIYSSQDDFFAVPRAYYAYLGLEDFACGSHQAWKESFPLLVRQNSTYARISHSNKSLTTLIHIFPCLVPTLYMSFTLALSHIFPYYIFHCLISLLGVWAALQYDKCHHLFTPPLLFSSPQ